MKSPQGLKAVKRINQVQMTPDHLSKGLVAPINSSMCTSIAEYTCRHTITIDGAHWSTPPVEWRLTMLPSSGGSHRTGASAGKLLFGFTTITIDIKSDWSRPWVQEFNAFVDLAKVLFSNFSHLYNKRSTKHQPKSLTSGVKARLKL